ncbi:MAG TPA: hypothetical protein VJT69_09535 [Pyrinomonadaceae bacterium]|nr:hypothetical protein [Pyrinomonadaceae bacterium]
MNISLVLSILMLASSSAAQERIFENKIPAHIPIKIKIRKEKEESFKDLKNAGLEVIELDYKMSKQTDRYGNEFKYRAKVKDTNKAKVARWAWDVFLQSVGL